MIQGEKRIVQTGGAKPIFPQRHSVLLDKSWPSSLAAFHVGKTPMSILAFILP